MSQNTADIVGSVGSSFTITLDSATVVRATLVAAGRPDYPMVPRGEKEIVVDSLPAGDSVLNLDLVWSPNDHDANIDLGAMLKGSVKVASPRPTIPAGETPAFIRLFGTNSTGPR